MTRERRPIPARALIVGAILAVAALGLTIVGGVTFLAQRDRTLTDIDERLISQIDALNQVDELRVVVEGGAVAATQDTPDDFTDLSAYLRAAVSRLIPGRNEASIAVIDGRIAFRSANALSQQIADDPDFVAEAVEQARPADQAVIGLCDRIFCRVGAQDNLARGESTFMVEMIETAAILNLLGVAAVRLGEFQAAFGFALVTREGQSGPFGERQKRRHDNRH